MSYNNNVVGRRRWFVVYVLWVMMYLAHGTHGCFSICITENGAREGRPWVGGGGNKKPRFLPRSYVIFRRNNCIVHYNILRVSIVRTCKFFCSHSSRASRRVSTVYDYHIGTAKNGRNRLRIRLVIVSFETRTNAVRGRPGDGKVLPGTDSIHGHTPRGKSTEKRCPKTLLAITIIS